MATPQVFREAIQLLKGMKPAPRDGAPPTAAAATVTLVEGSHVGVIAKRASFKITSGSIAVAEADGFGSFEFADLPTNPISLLAVKTALVLTKDGVGYIAATDLDVAIGTAAATAADLTTTPEESDVVDVNTFAASALAPAVAIHSASNATPAAMVLPTGAKSLFLNLSGATETGEDAVVTVNGTIEITWMDLG